MQAYARRCTVGRMEPHRPDTLGPAASGEADDPRLEAARAAFPDWEITRQWHGYEAVPRGTPVHRSMFLDGLLEKLRAWGAGGERPVTP
jgi:hypothetical protein